LAVTIAEVVKVPDVQVPLLGENARGGTDVTTHVEAWAALTVTVSTPPKLVTDFSEMVIVPEVFAVARVASVPGPWVSAPEICTKLAVAIRATAAPVASRLRETFAVIFSFFSRVNIGQIPITKLVRSSS